MRLHGIELAKPDEWWVCAAIDDSSRFVQHISVEATPLEVPGHPALDCFLVEDLPHLVRKVMTKKERPGLKCIICFGPSGTLVGYGDTQEAAVAFAKAYLDAHYDHWSRRIIGWLETHPLSPRYRYTGGG